MFSPGRALALTFLGLMIAGSALAQTTDTFEVRATVVNACSIAAADLDFGDYDPNSLLPTVGTAKRPDGPRKEVETRTNVART